MWPGIMWKRDGMIVDTTAARSLTLFGPCWRTYQQIEQRSPQRSRVQLPLAWRDFNILPWRHCSAKSNRFESYSTTITNTASINPVMRDSCMARQNAEPSKACA